MIHVDSIPVDVEEMRDWANGYKATKQISWAAFGDLVDVPGGTLQPFCKGNYAGRNEPIAQKLFKFRQTERSRDDHRQGIPIDPGYIETPTSLRIRALIAEASTGTITVGGLSPGLGKTKTAEEALGRISPAWMVTLDEATVKPQQVIRALEKAIGLRCARNWPSYVFAEIISFLRKKRATLIIDEANHANFKSVELLRSLHDATDVGICLLGNEELISQIQTGKMRDAFGRLNSRISETVIQNTPEEEDVVCFLDAWKIGDPGIRKLLLDVAMRPGSGALREVRQIIKKASLFATDDDGQMQLAHVRWAIDRRAQRILRA